jgi:hypothetical protein
VTIRDPQVYPSYRIFDPRILGISQSLDMTESIIGILGRYHKAKDFGLANKIGQHEISCIIPQRNSVVNSTLTLTENSKLALKFTATTPKSKVTVKSEYKDDILPAKVYVAVENSNKVLQFSSVTVKPISHWLSFESIGTPQSLEIPIGQRVIDTKQLLALGYWDGNSFSEDEIIPLTVEDVAPSPSNFRMILALVFALIAFACLIFFRRLRIHSKQGG